MVMQTEYARGNFMVMDGVIGNEMAGLRCRH
jgi:hypothetical protein